MCGDWKVKEKNKISFGNDFYTYLTKNNLISFLEFTSTFNAKTFG